MNQYDCRYLEKKRMMFPRFFFVSDPALLEILGQASDSHTIQNHLLSIFDNTRYVKFHDIEYNKMTAIISSEGETILVRLHILSQTHVKILKIHFLHFEYFILFPHIIIFKSFTNAQ